MEINFKMSDSAEIIGRFIGHFLALSIRRFMEESLKKELTHGTIIDMVEEIDPETGKPIFVPLNFKGTLKGKKNVHKTDISTRKRRRSRLGRS